MHRVVQDQIERALNRSELSSEALAHLEQCEACREQFAAMKDHSGMLRQMRSPDEAEPRAGFYARVLERIEAEGPVSIWNIFMESPFGRRIAFASLALAVLLGGYLVTSERSAVDPIVTSQISISATPTMTAMPAHFSEDVAPSQIGDQNPLDQVFVDSLPVSQVSVEHGSDDSVLSNLMTYREQ